MRLVVLIKCSVGLQVGMFQVDAHPPLIACNSTLDINQITSSFARIKNIHMEIQNFVKPFFHIQRSL